ncbi:MAG: diaminopimelate epimerase [Candidatus Marisimplicoccus sp.]
MMINFSKYSGAGNNFVVIDNREDFFNLSKKQITRLLDMNRGIGGDGLILINKSKKYDFNVVHYTPDGNLGSLCGNGTRCAIAYAHKKNIINIDTIFEAYDGVHKASVVDDELIEMQMKINSKIIKNDYGLLIDTGSPHLIIETSNTDDIDVEKEAKLIRYSDNYKENGVNVNYVQKISDEVFKIRTYERGVEYETMACGTGSTASAICMNYIGKTTKNKIKMKCLGGDLTIKFKEKDKDYSEITHIGAAQEVFKGSFEI